MYPKRFASYLAEEVIFIMLFSSVQLLSHVRLFASPWTVARQASLSFAASQSLFKLVYVMLMPSTHLILCHSLLLLPSLFPSIRVFSNELALHIKWPKYWSFSFSISPSNEHSGLLFSRIDCWSPLKNSLIACCLTKEIGAIVQTRWHIKLIITSDFFC